ISYLRQLTLCLLHYLSGGAVSRLHCQSSSGCYRLGAETGTLPRTLARGGLGGHVQPRLCNFKQVTLCWTTFLACLESNKKNARSLSLFLVEPTLSSSTITTTIRRRRSQ
ncbi:unnamed protein product, partial [Ectocarpus sp. 12 AP-2014]